jgi:hypothetical protein
VRICGGRRVRFPPATRRGAGPSGWWASAAALQGEAGNHPELLLWAPPEYWSTCAG